MAGFGVVPSQMSVDKLLVGLEHEQEIIENKLARGTNDLDVLLIVGMGGIGKTTMARKMYRELNYHFHIRAFCCVSQTYNKRKLLLEILSQVTQLPHRTKEMAFEDLGECLYRRLKGRRYLIVMDDLWDIAAWNDLGCFFPNDCNQSRILITSRQNDVVSQVKQGTPPYFLRLLSEEESWELLEKKAFHQGSCPPDLLDLGRKIAISCQGLPLAIVVVAGILTRTGQQREKWKQIALNVSTHAQIECSPIFELSYKDLPQHLKRCFLYLAAFPEDFQIPVRKLIQLWIAEGFIPGTENRHLEDLAEDFLKDLIGRNLVMVSETRSIGGSKMCHLHDLMLEFCLGKAKEEMFMQRIQGGDSLSAFGSLDVSNPRLCCYYRGKSLKLSKFLFSPRLRSLLLFTGDKCRRGNDCTFIFGLKHLTVLELAGLSVDNSFFEMELPDQLRYLAVHGFLLKKVSPLISRLSKLETLIVEDSSRKIDLPGSVWEMVTLRHLSGDANFHLPNPRGRKLENLQTLNFLCLGKARKLKQALEAVPNLRNLKCIFISPEITREVGLANLGSLSQLESLHLSGTRRGLLFRSGAPFVPLSRLYSGTLPSNLRKLTIARTTFCKNICGLPNLEVLKMVDVKFGEDRWCMTDDENFRKLKYLELFWSSIELWDASCENFPSLEKLVLYYCCELERIPLSFGEIPTLQWIDVLGVRHSVVSSARQIQEEQKDMGNEELKVEVSYVI